MDCWSWVNTGLPQKTGRIFWSSGKSCVVIQSIVLNKCAYTSSLGSPEKSGLKWDQFNWLFAIGMGGCSGNGLGLFGSCGCSASPAGMIAGWCGSSIGMSNGWSGPCCPSAGASAGGLGSCGCSVGTSWGWSGGWCGKSTSKSSESELTTVAALPDFSLVL